MSLRELAKGVLEAENTRGTVGTPPHCPSGTLNANPLNTTEESPKNGVPRKEKMGRLG
jgi:hypothetical protein